MGEKMKPGSKACEHGKRIYFGVIANSLCVDYVKISSQMEEYCPVTELEELKEKLAVAVEALERVKAPLTDAEIDCVGDTSSEERFAMRNWTRKKIAREALEKIGELK